MQQKFEALSVEESSGPIEGVISWALNCGTYSLLSGMLLIGSLLVLTLRQHRKVMLALIVTLFVFGLGVIFYKNEHHASVVKISLPLRQGPSVIFPPTNQINPGVKLVWRMQDGWAKIVLPFNLSGWVEGSELKARTTEIRKDTP